MRFGRRRGRRGQKTPLYQAASVAAVAAAAAAAGAMLALYGAGDGGQYDGYGADGVDGGSPAQRAPTADMLRTGGSPVLGDPDAPVTVLEYGDYQCTFCYRFHQSTLDQLHARYVDKGKVNIVFKDFALNGPDSVLAAEASRCAGDQGAYWEYHDALYDNWGGERTGWVTPDALRGFAAQIGGIDQAAFAECLGGHAHRDAVIRSYHDGQQVGIDATPSFIVFNDHRAVRIVGNQPVSVFERTIDGLIQTPGPPA